MEEDPEGEPNIVHNKGWYLVENETGETFTLNDAHMDRGVFDGDIKKKLEDGYKGTEEDPTFVARSLKDARVGYEGFVKYGLPDGTVMVSRFWKRDSGSHELRVTFDGPRAGRYKAKYSSDKVKPGRILGKIKASEA